MSNEKELTHEEQMRELRVLGSNNGGVDSHSVARVKAFSSKVHNRTTPAIVKNVKDRVIDAGTVPPKGIAGRLEQAADYLGAYKGISGIIEPEYDLLEPFSIYDTEVYVKRAIARKLALMFRNGWDVISDIDHNENNVRYIKKRLATLEYVMNMPTETFFSKILFDLLLTSNCFLLKIRDEKASGGIKNPNNGNKKPVAGYAFIPTNQILPWLEQGKLIFWRRFYETGIPYEDFQPDDIVHLKWNVKNGHFFGTPSLVGVVDDIYALRRLEENIELLFINYLFPLFHVKVGSKEAPCWYGPNGESEVDFIRSSIEHMPKEGVFVSDERVEVEPVGAQGSALNTDNLIAHLKARVFTGLGVSGIDLGETDTANRTTADNVSQNLKDDIKSEMTKFCDLIRMHLFKEWFQEANYSLSVQAAVATTRIRFNEIDVDNQIKMQNHYIQLWLNDALTEDEYRRALNRAPMTNKEKGQTHSAIAFEREKEMFDMTASSQLDLAQYNAEASHSLESMTPGNKSKKAPVPGAQGAANLSANKARPRNQHKTNPGPTKAKSARANFYQMAVDRVSELSSTNTNIPWDEVAAEVLAELSSHKTINLSDNVSYTKEPCIDAFVSEIKTLMSLADGTEMLSVLVNDNLQRIEGNYGDEQQLQREESQPDLSDKDSSTGSSEDTTVGDGIRT